MPLNFIDRSVIEDMDRLVSEVLDKNSPVRHGNGVRPEIVKAVMKWVGLLYQDIRLYAVTTFQEKGPQYGSQRTVAICASLERAKEIVETNEGDIFETTYTYAVISSLMPNVLYAYEDEQQWWYEWQGNSENGKYMNIPRPDKFANIIGWWE